MSWLIDVFNAVFSEDEDLSANAIPVRPIGGGEYETETGGYIITQDDPEPVNTPSSIDDFLVDDDSLE